MCDTAAEAFSTLASDNESGVNSDYFNYQSMQPPRFIENRYWENAA
jgi:hypothetical protein